MSTVYIIGAGATRGASFVKNTDHCKPALDADFYTQIQRISNQKHLPLVREVVADAVELFGTNFSLTLETMFTTLEYTKRMLKTTGKNKAFKPEQLQAMRDRLMLAIAAAFEESLTIKSGPKNTLEIRECEYHEALVKNMLPKDTIISFNYDCLIDSALKKFGGGKWNARYGYGFNLGSRGANLEGEAPWQPVNPSSDKKSINLFKLHGSLHFQIKERKDKTPKVKLKQRPYTQQNGNLHFTIIPPESNKQFDQGVFRHLWQQAAGELHRAKNIVIIGYSLPPTDLHSTALLRTSVKKEGLESLIVVNPDREARRRTRDILHRGLNAETKVLSFNTLEELVSAQKSGIAIPR